MTETPSDIKGEILGLVDQTFDLGVEAGKQQQQSTIDDLTQQLADANSAIGDQKAQIDALEARVAELEGQIPQPAGPVIGMNFKPSAQAHEDQAKAARIYVDNGRTDIHQEPEFVRAYGLGVRVFVFSWKDTAPKWFATVPDDLTWYGVHWHEPEDDIANGTLTLATWKQRQADQMPKVRAAGGIPAVILMGYTLSPASKRNPADYTLPKGLVDAYGIDFYPDKSPNRTQAQMIGAFKDALKTWGVEDWLIGEYGVIGSAADADADIAEVKALAADAKVILYWSSQASGKPDYHFTQQTADAWFA